MAKEKVERNRLIATLYNQGKTDQEILEELLRKGFNDYKGVKSVGMQVARLRKAGKLPLKRPLINKITKREVDKSRKLQVDKKAKLQKDKIYKLKV